MARVSMPHIPGIDYIVSCQCPDDPDGYGVPTILSQREDIHVHFTPTIGSSVNRNNALSLATAEYILLGDDDVTYNVVGLLEVIKAFDRNPDIDIATFKYIGANRSYPSKAVDITDFKVRHAYADAITIALRRESLARVDVRFSEEFGLNTEKFEGGEESVFLERAWRAGLRGRFFPISIVEHRGLSTMSRPKNKKKLRSSGAVLALIYPRTSLLRVLKMTFAAGGNIFANFSHLIWGWSYGVRHRRRILGPTVRKN